MPNFFVQKKLSDYLSASFLASSIIFNNPLHIVLYISSLAHPSEIFRKAKLLYHYNI